MVALVRGTAVSVRRPGWSWGAPHPVVMTRQGAPVLTVSGPAPLRSGPWQGARWIEATATNACPNPSFETGVANWEPREAGATFASSTTLVAFGAGGAALTSSAGTGWHYAWMTPRPAIGAGETWTYSAHAQAGTTPYLLIVERGDAVSHCVIFDLAAGTVTATLNASGRITAAGLGPGIYRCEMTYTAASAFNAAGGPGAGVAGLDFTFTAVGTETVYLDGFQAERAPAATSYADGSLGAGYAWSGVAHASASTREASAIELPGPLVDPRSGGLVAVLRPGWAGGVAAEHVVLHRRAAADAEVFLAHTAGGAWRLSIAGPAGTGVVEVPAVHAAGVDVTLIAGWGPARLEIALGAGTPVSAARSGPPPVLGADVPAMIGRRADSSSAWLDGGCGGIAGFARPLTPGERALAARWEATPPV